MSCPATGHAYCAIMKFLWIICGWETPNRTKKSCTNLAWHCQSSAPITIIIIIIIWRWQPAGLALQSGRRTSGPQDRVTTIAEPWLSCDRLHFDKTELATQISQPCVRKAGLTAPLPLFSFFQSFTKINLIIAWLRQGLTAARLMLNFRNQWEPAWISYSSL